LNTAPWQKLVRDGLAKVAADRCVVVVFPEYRPDLVEQMARVIKLVHVDFRRERMAPLGWNAAELPLDTLNDTAVSAMAGGSGVVLQNAEALLATRTAEERRGWFTRALDRSWPAQLVLPVTLFGVDLPPRDGQVVVLPRGSLPEEKILSRLATMR
jgi:hypothetical protein